MNISLIYAISENGVIGKAGGLPWHVPSDLKQFKAITRGKPIIMGRKTWESLPRKPLPDRKNIVISRQTDFAAQGAIVVADKFTALAACEETAEVCVIGGADIFNLFYAEAKQIYLTRILGFVEGDVHLAELPPAQWHEVSRSAVQRNDGDSHAFEVIVYQRKEA